MFISTLLPIGVLEQVKTHTVKPVLSDHIKQDIFLAFRAVGCLLLHESSAENYRSFLCYFHSAVSNHLSGDFHVT